MRIEGWHPEEITLEIEKKAMDRLYSAGLLVASRARGMVPIGKNRPPYKNGKEWTERRAGTLKASIRVTRLKGDPKMNIRIYAGHRAAYYARWVEMGTKKMAARPYLRPALNASKSSIKNMVENGGE